MQESLSFPFSAAALFEAESVRERIAPCSTLPLVQGITLDPTISQDLDDAFWVTQDICGGYELRFSIANVASFLSPLETPALEQEAHHRSRTLYVAEKAVRPLLPSVLSEELLSLQEGSWRPALTLTVLLDALGNPGEFQIEQTRVLNVRRFAYEEADGVLQGPPQTEAEVVLALAYAVAHILLRRRKEGESEEIVAQKQCASSIIPHTFAILVNRLLANFLADRHVPALYRVHPREERTPDGAAHTLMRASYAAAVGSHFRLGLSGYLQSTSPLRRYGDLVNQRIVLAVLAVLAKQDLPYTEGILQQIASYLNEREETLLEEERQELQLDRECVVLQIFMSSDGEVQKKATLEAADAQFFHEILLVMVAQPDLPVLLEQEIIRRIEGGQLPPYDLLTCLCRSPHERSPWRRVKIAGIAWLQHHPNLATTLLSLGSQVLAWDTPTYRERWEGSDNARLFHASAELLVASQLHTSNVQTAHQRSRAKQLACLDLLARIAGVQDARFEVPLEGAIPAPFTSVAPEKGTCNPVSSLNELKQQGIIHAFDYQYEQTGPPHNRSHTCRCSLILDDSQVVEGIGAGKTKKEAASQAAEQAMEAAVHLIEAALPREEDV
jgi:ribonuclease R